MKISTSARIFYACVLLTLALAIDQSFVPIDSIDTDTWWHLASGRYLVTHMQFPVHDPLSFTSDVRWIQFEWLFDVAAYLCMQAGGLPAVIALRTVAVILCFVLFFGIVRRLLGGGTVRGMVALLMAVFAIMVLRFHFHVRPHMFGYVSYLIFLALFFWYVDSLKAPPSRVVGPNRFFVLAVAGLTLVTVNFHPTFILILGTMGLWLVCQVASQWLGWSPVDPPRMRTMSWALALSCLAALVTPLGSVITFYCFDYALPHVYTRTIQEWLPPHLLSAASLYTDALLLLDVVTIVALLRQKRLYPVVILLLLTRQALSSLRYVAYLCLFAVPASALAFRPLLDATLATLTPRLQAVASRPILRQVETGLSWAGLVGALALFSMVIRAHLPLTRCMAWDTFPIDAVWFLRSEPVPGPLFNAFEWGGYLTWELPEQKVFIDARNDVAYSEKVYVDYLNIIRAGGAWEKLLDRYGVNTVLLRTTPPVLELNAVITRAPGWKEVYRDHNAVIYVRSSIPARWSTKVPMASASAYLLCYEAQRSIRRGEVARARELAALAVERDPWYGLAYGTEGTALALGGQVEQARVLWEGFLALDPNAQGVHLNLAIYWKIHGDLARARWHAARELEADPQCAEARKLLEQSGGL